MTRLQWTDQYRLRVPADPRLSPDGRTVVYVLHQDDEDADEARSALWLVGVEGGRPWQLTLGDDDSAPRWSPDGSSVVFLRKQQLWLMPVDGGEARQLTSRKLGAGSALWHPSGKKLAFCAPADLGGEDVDQDKRRTEPVVIDRIDYKADGSGLVRQLRNHLFVLDLAEDAAPEQVTSGDFHVSGPSWSPDGSLVYCVTDGDVTPRSTVFVGDRRIEGGDQLITGTYWSPSGLLLTATGAKSTGHVRLVSSSLDSLTPGFDRNVIPGGPGYPGAAPQALGSSVVFAARDRGCTHIYSVPASGGTPRKIIGSPSTVISGLSVVDSLLCYVESSPSSAGDVFVTTVDGSPRRLTDYRLHDVSLFEPSPVSFTVTDGTSVHGWLLRDPSATSPGPLLLDIHGGPHNAWSPVFDGKHFYHQVLVSKGWSVLLLNPRASDGYGSSYFTAGLGGWGVADQQDFVDPVRSLISSGIASSVAVCGYSYGGFATCWLTAHTDLFAAAVAGGCVSDLTSMYGTSDAGHFIGSRELRALPHSDPDALAAQNPIASVHRVETPTLLLHGENDDRCPIGQAEQWFTALRVRGVPTRLVRYPGASHLFVLVGRPSHRLDYNRRIAEWVEEHAR
ncbi:S9 family peptidase [Allokutzneria sp. A3M-2-11 16]|uniref:S9 family peptidase n=1 Tax=Allokutzneria sp. A3M-2-11 16 TaxID=2962043 RepID=UPI0020B85C4C|nr:S9 family peptidase [Allokutzneria sp. A3M-2-11 16]MCP3804309.1 S9 family peptidase [Allokutzneria sp. A3M-2-11 16]